jgi:hypothetical protein
MEIKIRPLTNRDFFTVVNMLSKISGEAGRVMSSLITSRKTVKAGSKEDAEQLEALGQQIALAVLEACYKHVQDDLIKWFASLIGKSVNEYLDQMPPSTTLQIIEQLKEAQETKDFFTRAWRLSKEMSKSASQFTGKSKK